MSDYVTKYLTPFAMVLLVIVAILAIVLNPTVYGVMFACVVLLGVGTVWLLRQLLIAASNRDE
jgi:hypothetical protein